MAIRRFASDCKDAHGYAVRVSGLDFKQESIGHLLAHRWLVVPPYQRPYAWQVENVAQFWEDLASAHADNRAYFIGAVVLTERDGDFHVIDGQQRLVTASLLIAAIRDELAAIGEDAIAENVEQTFLRTFDRRVGRAVPRLQVSSGDLSFYSARFILRSGGQPETASQRRMLEAFMTLRNEVSKLGRAAATTERIKLLNSWIDLLEQAVIVVVVETETNSDAFQIFETLNDRGAPLTISDLLKNYLMSLTPDETAPIQTGWEEALAYLGADIETQEFVTFIRHYWNSVHGATRERDLYRSLRSEITSGDDAVAFASDLAEAAEPYAAIADGSHPFWSAEYGEAPRAADSLLNFQLGQYRPLLLAALQKFPPDEVERLALALVGWSFRGLVVGGIGGGSTERAYAQAGVLVRQGDISDTDGVYKRLLPMIPSDEEFLQAFERASLPRARVSHYVLRSLNRSLSDVAHPSLEPSPSERTAAVTTQLLPRSADPAGWPGFASEEIPRSVNRIGNLFLRSPNQKVSASDWHTRSQAVLELPVPLNTFMFDPGDGWGTEQLKARQHELGVVAVQIWQREPS